jgi:hypothetical protein
MIDAYLNIVAAKIGMAPHTLKVCIVVGGVGAYVWEFFKYWIAPRMIAWQPRKKGPEPRLEANNAMTIPVTFNDVGEKSS